MEGFTDTVFYKKWYMIIYFLVNKICFLLSQSRTLSSQLLAYVLSSHVSLYSSGADGSNQIFNFTDCPINYYGQIYTKFYVSRMLFPSSVTLDI